MPTSFQPASIAAPAPPQPPAALDLAAFSYEERKDLLPAVSEALTLCGCWLIDRRALSATQLEFRFELQLRAIVELYAALIASGLELTRGSHLELTALCTVRQHRGRAAGAHMLVNVRLEVTFLDDICLPSVLSTGTAFA